MFLVTFLSLLVHFQSDKEPFEAIASCSSTTKPTEAMIRGKNFAPRPGRLTVITRLPQRLPCITRVLTQLFEFIRFNRKFAVRSLIHSAEREMFFNHTSAKGNGCNRSRCIERVIGQARHNVKTPAQFGKLPNICLAHRCRVRIHKFSFS